jgi:hypothetical protein
MRIRTIGLIMTLALGVLAAALPADAQQAGKVHRIGFLTLAAPPESSGDSAVRVRPFGKACTSSAGSRNRTSLSSTAGPPCSPTASRPWQRS